MTSATPFRIAGQDPPSEPDPVKTYCKDCCYMFHPYFLAKWEHWKCGAPIEGKINPVTGKQLYRTAFCDKRNSEANCSDFIHVRDVAKKPWWRFWR